MSQETHDEMVTNIAVAIHQLLSFAFTTCQDRQKTTLLFSQNVHNTSIIKARFDECLSVISRGYPGARRSGSSLAEQQFFQILQECTAPDFLQRVSTATLPELQQHLEHVLCRTIRALSGYLMRALADQVEAGTVGEIRRLSDGIACSIYYQPYAPTEITEVPIEAIYEALSPESLDETTIQETTPATLWKDTTAFFCDTDIPLTAAKRIVRRYSPASTIVSGLAAPLPELSRLVSGVRFYQISEPLDEDVPPDASPDLTPLRVYCIILAGYVLLQWTDEDIRRQQSLRRQYALRRVPSLPLSRTMLGGIAAGLLLLGYLYWRPTADEGAAIVPATVIPLETPVQPIDSPAVSPEQPRTTLEAVREDFRPDVERMQRKLQDLLRGS